ncbi:hypothetical protein LPY66_13080 [Dehalobacter sp. DCM]|uniref:hypothetical protein n=1 Tax=Dehalobacter sp. DCM TaxID=2907827 RepID=UPI0030813947|nr:hypothetical protein LPY66_13080 [Dehalobacter sp. DCM]
MAVDAEINEDLLREGIQYPYTLAPCRPRGMKVIVALCGEGSAPEWADVIQIY